MFLLPCQTGCGPASEDHQSGMDTLLWQHALLSLPPPQQTHQSNCNGNVYSNNNSRGLSLLLDALFIIIIIIPLLCIAVTKATGYIYIKQKKD